VAQAVAADEKDFGILVCTTGIGMSIAANKVKGARAALCSNELAARLSRNHNNANILVLGARFVDSANAKRIAGIFLESSFDGGRHDRRVGMIDNYQTFFDTEGQ
jgi:ribose 5-phosphate isomerase B